MKRRNFLTSLVAIVTGVKATTPVVALTPAVAEPVIFYGARFARQALPPVTPTDPFKIGFEIVHKTPNAQRLAGIWAFRDEETQIVHLSPLWHRQPE